MKDALRYKGYLASVHFSAEDAALFGRIEGIEDMVSFEGRSVDELIEAFHEAVEDYLSVCTRAGKPPEKSMKGSFNVRLGPELHREAHRRAVAEGKSLNQFVQDAVVREVRERSMEYDAGSSVAATVKPKPGSRGQGRK